MSKMYSISSREIWKAVPGYEGFYQVSNLGRVKSLPRVTYLYGIRKSYSGRILRPGMNSGGYFSAVLCIKGKMRSHGVHSLVAKAFVLNPDQKTEVNHKDGDKTNNVAGNLEWVTHGENQKHAYKLGLRLPMRGEGHKSHKLTNEQASEICKLYATGNFSQKEIGDMYGLNNSTVSRIVRRRSGYKV